MLPSLLRRNKGSFSRAIAVAATLLLSASASQSAPRDRWLDVPSLGSRRNVQGASVLSATCTVLSGRKARRAQCDFSQAVLSRPDAAKTAKNIAEIDAADHNRLAEFLRKTCSGKGPPDPSGGNPAAEFEYTKMLRNACTSGETEKLREALKWHEQEIEAKTCALDAVLFTEEFQQIDADTWTSASNSRGMCKVGALITLWRTPAELDLWSHKEVLSVPPSVASNPFCKLRLTDEFSSMQTLRETGCAYFR